MISIESQHRGKQYSRSLHGFATIIHKDRIYYHGGYDLEGERSNLFLEIDTRTMESITLPSGDVQPRDGHSLVGWNNSLILFGGGDIHRWYNDVWSFSLDTHTWTCLTDRYSTSSAPVEDVSPVCPARAGHNAWVYRDRMYISHGWDGNCVLNDTWYFDLYVHTWHKVATKGEIQPFDSSSIVQLPHGDILLIGGGVHHIRSPSVYRFSHLNNEWTLITESPHLALSGHGSILCGDTIYTFGGTRNKNKNSPNSINRRVLCTDINTGYTIPLDMKSPYGYGVRAVTSFPYIYVFGGFDGLHKDYCVNVYSVKKRIPFSRYGYRCDVVIQFS